MANQLVVIGNRVVAHGTDCFADVGGAVVDLINNKAYAGASLVECPTDCPADIDSVGYEYHSGIFVPCAPYGQGNGNGYFMEVGEDCATPRNSGLPIKDINWGKIGSVACTMTGIKDKTTKDSTFPISSNALSPYSMLRYRIKAGSWFTIGRLYWSTTALSHSLLSVGEETIYKIASSLTSSYGLEIRGQKLTISKDIVIPFYMVNATMYGAKVTDTSPLETTTVFYRKWYSPSGGEIDPLSISLTMPGGVNDPTAGVYYYSGANVVVELEGRK